MARITPSPILERISGAVGGFVFRHLRGRTFMSRRPQPGDREPSEAQAAHRERFRMATAYARVQIADAEGQAYYAPVAAERQLSTYNVAVADYLNPPVIMFVDAGDYDGLPGDPIRVVATDDVGVTRVHISIMEPDGTLIEEGEASLDGFQWVYSTLTNVEATPAVVVEAMAFDRPGNSATATAEVDLSS